MKITKKKLEKLINEESEKVIKEMADLIRRPSEATRKPKFASIKDFNHQEWGNPKGVAAVRNVHGKDAQALAMEMAPWILNWITHWSMWNVEGADGGGKPTQSFDDFMEDFTHFMQQAVSSGLRRPLFYKIYNKAVMTMHKNSAWEESEQERIEREEREGRVPASTLRDRE